MEDYEIIQHEIEKASIEAQARLDEQNAILREKNSAKNTYTPSHKPGFSILDLPQKTIIKIILIVVIGGSVLSIVIPALYMLAAFILNKLGLL